jgi:hypothetical protein
MTGPIREMEAVLGHRLQVGSIERQSDRRGVYHVVAWSHLEVSSLEQSAVAVLRQLQTVAGSVLHRWRLDARPGVDLDQVTAYYWEPPEQFGLSAFTSSGVSLQYNTWKAGPELLQPPGLHESIEEFSQHARNVHHYYNGRSMPLVKVVEGRQETSDFLLTLDVWIRSSNKRKLLDLHWPEFAKHLPEGVELVDIAKRSFDQGPFKLKVQKVFRQLTDDQAVAACLTAVAGLRIRLEHDNAGRLKWLGASEVPKPDAIGIVGYSLVQIIQPIAVATNRPRASATAMVDGGT